MTKENISTATKNRPMRVLLRVDIHNGFMPHDPNIPGTGELPVAGAPAIVPADIVGGVAARSN